MSIRAFLSTAMTVPLIAACSVAGCGPDAPGHGQAVIRDSAGVRIVENSMPSWPEGAGWRLSDEPLLEIGVLEGEPEYQLFRAFDGTLLDDGRIVVANAGSHELRAYDSQGRFIESKGGEGAGPGEFRSMGLLERFANDSLFTWDWRNNRAQIFSPQLEFVRSFRPGSTGDGGNALLPEPLAIFRDGWLLAREQRAFTPNSDQGVSRDSILYSLYDATGAVLDTVGRFSAAEYFVKIFPNSSMTVTGLAFGRSTQVAAGDDRFYLGTGDSYEIGEYTREGELVRLIRLERPNLAVTAEDRELYAAERLESASEEWRPRLRQMLDDMPYPATMPAYSDIRVDAGGYLWVADYRRPADDEPRWNVFDPEGRLLGAVETPQRFRVFEIGSDYVLGRHADELDVERVRLYRLEKPMPVTAAEGAAQSSATKTEYSPRRSPTSKPKARSSG